MMKEVANRNPEVLSPLLRHVTSNSVCFCFNTVWEKESWRAAVEPHLTEF